MSQQTSLEQAALAIADADALVIGAGAGMGVDSGLPDFRGNEGFWKAYPPFAKLGLGFVDLANPAWFVDDPPLAWGFYGHRLHLYRATHPHEGFAVLKRWAESKRHGAFVYTSNVDGQFQQAGFAAERILEVHGSIAWLQCTRACGIGLFSSEGVTVRLDEATMRAHEPLPACPRCGALTRPNILLFGDGDWDYSRTWEQEERLRAWLAEVRGARLAVVECGAGKAIPTVRRFCEEIAARPGGTLVRVNVREADVPKGQIGLALGARDALARLDALVGPSC